MEAFIDDGYNRTVTIHAREGVYPGGTMTYRPMVGREYTIGFAKSLAGNEQADDEVLEMLSDHIADWSFGRPPTVENMKRMVGPLLDRIMRIVLGIDAPDGVIGEDGVPKPGAKQLDDDAGN